MLTTEELLARSAISIAHAGERRSCEMVFIVQAKPWKPDGIEKVIAATRKEALQAATNFQRKFPVVTVVADGRVYTLEEFAKTMVDVEAA